MRTPAGLAVPNRPGILPGIDVKGDGGYVAVPPSRVTVEGVLRSDGTWGQALLPYRWADGCACQVPEVPRELMGWIINAPAGGGGHGPGGQPPVSLDGLAADGLAVGERNVQLYRAACSLFRRFGTGPAGRGTVSEQLGQILANTDMSGFPPSEVQRTVRSALAFIEDQEAADRAEWDQWMNRRWS
jgi:hypothetical protein